ncbi:hypothetical protein M8J76_015437 [Diaphorina citri]|nr:hypothetical protein M8J75_004209 [Diaphorina citri]KAI5745910.1 hypothetical protein M8J76_015437 [Diaphorina citri]KAI5752032.1 hypothetical protein M8J77_013099 [Diaphorina citri]
MGNTGTTRRNSLFLKQESGDEPPSHKKEGVTHSIARRLTLSGGKGLGLGSRQNTLLEEEIVPPCVNSPPPEPLTEDEKKLLIETWKILEDDIAKVGVITFISLFETHPDVQQSFMPFNNIELEDLKHSKQLRAHALR